jgi:hypothetical protein
MVLFDPHRRWGPRGICRYEDRGLFFAEGGMHNRRPAEAVQALWNQAKEICAMCPVLEECKRDTLGEEYGVYGGLDQFERYKMRRALPQAVKNWPKERQAAWGRELSLMRDAGLTWTIIQTQCGLPPTAAEFLVNTWKAAQPKEKAVKKKVVDLQLPSLGRRPDFPEKSGRMHAWVRHRGGISDAWYRGETADGKWIHVTTYSGRGNVNKWFATEDVKLYRPQAVVILNYSSMPAGRAAENGLKTHCPRGHLYTKENTRVSSRGWRTCRACGNGRESDDREEESARAAA